VKSMPADFRVSITKLRKTAYPFSAHLAAHSGSGENPDNGKILADFLNWMSNDGQKMVAGTFTHPAQIAWRRRKRQIKQCTNGRRWPVTSEMFVR